MNRTIINYLFDGVIVFLVFWGAHAWFTWFLDNSSNGLLTILVSLLLAFISYVYKSNNKVILNTSTNTLLGLGLFCFIFLYDNRISFMIVLVLFLKIYPLWVLLSDDNQIIHRNRLVSVVCVILLPGILLHIYFQIAGFFPSIPIQYPNSNNYLFFNYFFLIKGAASYQAEGIRFQSVFLEPGYLGALLTFLLYLVKFNMKKLTTIILFFSLTMSLSLAGYIISVMGWIFYKWSMKARISNYVVGFLLLTIALWGASQYNGGDNYVNTFIVQRVIGDDDQFEYGNKRTSEMADIYLEKSISDGSVIVGLGTEKIEKINGGKDWASYGNYSNTIRGAGYKIYLLYKGVICVVAFIMMYMCFGGEKFAKKTRYMWGFFFIILLVFLQASYPTSFSWLIPYIIGSRLTIAERKNKCCQRLLHKTPSLVQS